MSIHPLSRKTRSLVALGLAVGMLGSPRAATVFEDAFAGFAIGDAWQPHGAGAPDLALAVVGVGVDTASLRMGSSPGTGGEIVGIETATAFSLTGVLSVRVTARLRPLNQTGAGDGGASDASAGVAINGVSGAFARASAGANRPAAPDWGDFYFDSEGSANANAAFLHFPPNDPGGGAEAFRTFVIEISAEGTVLKTLASSGEPLAVTPFEVWNPNLTLADFGNSFTVALFQQRSDSHVAPENTFGDFDSLSVEIVTESDDRDGDGIPNAYEIENGLNPDANDANADLDQDTLSNLVEFQRGTRADKADTDGDGLSDSVETGTGTYVSTGDTGTNALKPDTDSDGLGDRVETNTGTYASPADTGTNPSRADTDGDGFNDGMEIGAGFDPTKAEDTPAGFASIRTAVEFQFYAAPGVSYRIEGSANLQVWTTVEASVAGAGNRVSRLYSTEGTPLRFYRAIVN